MRELGRWRQQAVLLPPLRERGRILKKIRVIGEEFSLRYTDAAQAQLETLPFDVLSRVEGALDRLCREDDPMELGHAEEGMPSRRRYEVDPVHVIAWVTSIEPDMRLLTVVEIVFPDQPVSEEVAPPTPCEPPPMPLQPPAASAPELPSEPKAKPRRILYPRRRPSVPAEV